jgi:hypothetical protein
MPSIVLRHRRKPRSLWIPVLRVSLLWISLLWIRVISMLAGRALRLWILPLWILWIAVVDETDIGLFAFNDPWFRRQVFGRDEAPPDKLRSFTAGGHDKFPVYPKWLPITRVKRRAPNLHTLSNHMVTGGHECTRSSSPNRVPQKS